MSFRKRNIGISSVGARGAAGSTITDKSAPAESIPQQSTPASPILPGIRPSPIDGRQTTSTGSASLDDLLAGHGGLALGSSLLLEESGTTDFAGALLRYYAAEGIVQGHNVMVVGVGEGWGRTLPGLIGVAGVDEEKGRRGKKVGSGEADKMKIAWRYERLGDFGGGMGVAGSRAAVTPEKPGASESASTNEKETPPAFCHAFDLTKRLTHPGISTIKHIPIAPVAATSSPFTSILEKIVATISSSPPNTIHRLIIPSLLSPALYPPHACLPQHLLQFVHSLRAILSAHSSQMTCLITLPLTLYPRDTALIGWIEHLCDGILELVPFPASAEATVAATHSTSGAVTAQEDPPQGLLKVHRLPVFHDRGGSGGRNFGEDFAFTLSRRKFAIKIFSLPPVEGDNEAQQEGQAGQPKKADLEF